MQVYSDFTSLHRLNIDSQSAGCSALAMCLHLPTKLREEITDKACKLRPTQATQKTYRNLEIMHVRGKFSEGPTAEFNDNSMVSKQATYWLTQEHDEPIRWSNPSYILESIPRCSVRCLRLRETVTRRTRLNANPHTNPVMMTSCGTVFEALLASLDRRWGVYRVLNELFLPINSIPDC